MLAGAPNSTFVELVNSRPSAPWLYNRGNESRETDRMTATAKRKALTEPVQVEAPRPGNSHGVPTILVAGQPTRSRDDLVQSLERDGYLVLRARDTAELLGIVKTHSRSIQILLVDGRISSPGLLTELGPYQPGIRVLLEAESPEATLYRVRELLKYSGHSV